MTNALGRVTGTTFSNLSVAPNEAPSRVSSEGTEDKYLNVINVFPLGVRLSPGVHREARIRVIQKAVETTLENPQHPYYGVGSAHRERMRRWITEAVVQSHLLEGEDPES